MTNTREPKETINQSIDQSKQILRISECPTLSSNSTLTYHIGCDFDESIYFRIKANSGGGFFNDEWIALAGIQQVFDAWPVDSPITSFALNGLFTGKSANSPAFLMAILKAEKLVVTLKGKSRRHEYQGNEEFLEGMNELIADGIDLKVEVVTDKKPVKSTKSNASAKRKATRSSKPQRK